MLQAIQKFFGRDEQLSNESFEQATSGVCPWNDRERSPQKRFEAYQGFCRDRMREIHETLQGLEKAENFAEFERIQHDPETVRVMAELTWLKEVPLNEFCSEMDQRAARAWDPSTMTTVVAKSNYREVEKLSGPIDIIEHLQVLSDGGILTSDNNGTVCLWNKSLFGMWRRRELFTQGGESFKALSDGRIITGLQLGSVSV